LVKEDERNAAVTRALMYEQLVEALEKEREINMAIIAASGERAVAAQKAVEDEEKKLQNEFDSIGIDVPDDVRADRIRQRLKRLYPAK
jgi:ABC-type sugar transport system substrate-binding protein